MQLKALAAAAKKKADAKKKPLSASASAMAEAKARKAKLSKQKDTTKFNQVGAALQCSINSALGSACSSKGKIMKHLCQSTSTQTQSLGLKQYEYMIE